MNKSKTIPVALLLTSVVSCPISASATTSNVAAVNQMEQQQSAACKGVVVDTNGEPLIGVSVVAKGTTNVRLPVSMVTLFLVM